jgi:hypothetical protein
MKKKLKKLCMHIAAFPDRESLAKRILRQEAGWDGKLPIPITWRGGALPQDLSNVQIIHTSGDDKCCWVPDVVSALILFLKGHDIITNTDVLKKRITFKS